MIPFLSIIIAIVAIIAMAYTIKSDTKLYRFTSTPYNKDKHAIFEVRSKSIDSAKESAIEMIAVYQTKVGRQLRWELIEELDNDTKEVILIHFKLPENKKVKV